jgi:hypothetical protein
MRLEVLTMLTMLVLVFWVTTLRGIFGYAQGYFFLKKRFRNAKSDPKFWFERGGVSYTNARKRGSSALFWLASF